MRSLVDVAGWTLLHFMWQASVIFLSYRALIWQGWEVGARGRYRLGITAAVSMVMVGIGTFAYESLTLTRPPFGLGATRPLVASVTDAFARHPHLMFLYQLDADRILDWIDVAWLLGVLILSVRVLGGFLTARHCSGNDSVISTEVGLRFRELIRSKSFSERARLRTNSSATSAYVRGIFSPTIVLPQSTLTRLTVEQTETILLHELAHIERGDPGWNLFQIAFQTLFFFHPAVWWLEETLRQERELACDDIVVRSCNDVLLYAKALLAMAEEVETLPADPLAIHANENRMHLLPRIARILDKNKEIRVSIPFIRSALVLLPIAFCALIICASLVSLAPASIIGRHQLAKLSVADHPIGRVTTGSRQGRTPSLSRNRAPANSQIVQGLKSELMDVHSGPVPESVETPPNPRVQTPPNPRVETPPNPRVETPPNPG
jgi:beta-lactamase regulating signal transducer with metallopeptidase domain